MNVSVVLWECVVETEPVRGAVPCDRGQRDVCDQAAGMPVVAFAVAFVFQHSALSIVVCLSLVKMEEKML